MAILAPEAESGQDGSLAAQAARTGKVGISEFDSNSEQSAPAGGQTAERCADAPEVPPAAAHGAVAADGDLSAIINPPPKIELVMLVQDGVAEPPPNDEQHGRFIVLGSPCGSLALSSPRSPSGSPRMVRQSSQRLLDTGAVVQLSPLARAAEAAEQEGQQVTTPRLRFDCVASENPAFQSKFAFPLATSEEVAADCLLTEAPLPQRRRATPRRGRSLGAGAPNRRGEPTLEGKVGSGPSSRRARSSSVKGPRMELALFQTGEVPTPATVCEMLGIKEEGAAEPAGAAAPASLQPASARKEAPTVLQELVLTLPVAPVAPGSASACQELSLMQPASAVLAELGAAPVGCAEEEASAEAQELSHVQPTIAVPVELGTAPAKDAHAEAMAGTQQLGATQPPTPLAGLTESAAAESSMVAAGGDPPAVLDFSQLSDHGLVQTARCSVVVPNRELPAVVDSSPLQEASTQRPPTEQLAPAPDEAPAVVDLAPLLAISASPPNPPPAALVTDVCPATQPVALQPAPPAALQPAPPAHLVPAAGHAQAVAVPITTGSLVPCRTERRLEVPRPKKVKLSTMSRPGSSILCAKETVAPETHDTVAWLMNDVAVPRMQLGDLGGAYSQLVEANVLHMKLYGRFSGDALYNLACCLSRGAAGLLEPGSLCDKYLPPFKPKASAAEVAEARLDLAAGMLESAVVAGYSNAANALADQDLQALRRWRPERFVAAVRRMPGAIVPAAQELVAREGGQEALGALVAQAQVAVCEQQRAVERTGVEGEIAAEEADEDDDESDVDGLEEASDEESDGLLEQIADSWNSLAESFAESVRSAFGQSWNWSGVLAALVPPILERMRPRLLSLPAALAGGAPAGDCGGEPDPEDDFDDSDDDSPTAPAVSAGDAAPSAGKEGAAACARSCSPAARPRQAAALPARGFGALEELVVPEGARSPATVSGRSPATVGARSPATVGGASPATVYGDAGTPRFGATEDARMALAGLGGAQAEAEEGQASAEQRGRSGERDVISI